MELSVVKNGKELRGGFTTGSCAAAASTAALEMLLRDSLISQVSIKLPSGEEADFEIEVLEKNVDKVKVAVIKDGGDDPDVTTGTKIVSEVSLLESDIIIDGGKGVGRITKKGLKCSVGEAAINPVPRKMIEENLRTVMEKSGYTGGASVIISVPEGEELAKRTYNPRLGIIGGISILGTTGIVDPMSEKAIVDTNKILIDKKFAEDSEIILISPGNFGRDFCKEYLNLDIDKSVPISNFVGETLDYIKYKGFKRILFVGHTGKIVKCAAGIMNTHSYQADGRMEIIGVHSALAGVSREKIAQIMECVSTDEAFNIIKEEPGFNQVKDSIMEKVMYHLNFRLKDAVKIEVVMFSTDRDLVLKSKGADEFIKMIEERNNKDI